MATNQLRIGWIGFHSEGFPALQTLLNDGIKIEAVITLKEDFLAKRSGGVDYAGLCKNFDVPLYKVGSINDSESVNLLKKLSLDIAFVVGWSQIVGSEALSTVRIGMIGAHASMLPHNRGSAPINWALIKGEKETGNSLLWLNQELDGGYIIDQTQIPISPYDTCATLYQRVADSNLVMIHRLIPRLLTGERPGKPQLTNDEPILPRRRPQDGLLEWNQDNEAVYNFIRALTRPYPGAFSWLGGRRWFLWKCALLPEEYFSGAKPGLILGPVVSPAEEACGQLVACGKGAILLLEIERDDGKIFCGRELSDQPWEGMIWLNE